MLNVGTINAGASVALVQLSGETIEQILQNEQNMLKAYLAENQVQQKSAQGNADQTIKAGQDQADATRCDAISSIASTIGSAISLGGSLYQGAISNSAIENYQEPADEVRTKIDENAPEAASFDATSMEDTERNALQERFANTKKAINGDKTAVNCLKDDDYKVLSPAQRKDLTDQIKYRNNQAESIKNRAANTSTNWQNGGNILNYAGQAGASFTKASYQTDQSEAQAAATLLQMVQGQIGQAMQTMLDNINQKAQSITQILNAKDQSMGAISYRG